MFPVFIFPVKDDPISVLPQCLRKPEH